ncbi:hypothetical protein K523DRAFT_152608 [Schizophyllum commune Tattone D]|nr:hypothetical protein K523DRAFT_152608 [Schizophyllum commune Tattone D]
MAIPCFVRFVASAVMGCQTLPFRSASAGLPHVIVNLDMSNTSLGMQYVYYCPISYKGVETRDIRRRKSAVNFVRWHPSRLESAPEAEIEADVRSC